MSTPARMNVLTAIGSLRDRYGYPPTLQEVADTLGVSKTTVFHHVARLQEEGHVTRADGIPRSLVVTPKGTEEAAQWA